MEQDNRESWLNRVAAGMGPLFETLDAPLPHRVRVAIGFTSTGRKGKAIGECWDNRRSADGHFEIFIRPDLAHDPDAMPAQIAAILAHELVHAAVGIPAGHGKAFKGHRPIHQQGADALPGPFRIGVELFQFHRRATAGMIGKPGVQRDLAIAAELPGLVHREAVAAQRIGHFGGDGRFGERLLQERGQVFRPVEMAELVDERSAREHGERGNIRQFGRAQDHGQARRAQSAATAPRSASTFSAAGSVGSMIREGRK